MNRMGANFRKDQSGMSTQLRRLQSLVRHLDEPLFEYLKSVGCDNFYFTFRWMLLHFKRELDYDGVKMVWEAIWSSPDPDHFHLFIVFAILQQVEGKKVSKCLVYSFFFLSRFETTLSCRSWSLILLSNFAME